MPTRHWRGLKHNFGPHTAEEALSVPLVSATAHPVPTARDTEPPWPTCQLTSTCVGIQASGFDRCLAHLSPADRDTVVRRLRPGADLDARGTTFDAALFSRVIEAVTPARGSGERCPRFGTLRLDHARFTGPVWWDRARFDGPVSFDNAHIDGYAGFRRVRFAALARFDGAQFTGPVRFDGARFDGHAVFRHTHFTGNAGFDHTRFAKHAVFTSAQFGAHAVFRHTQIAGPVWFDGAQVAGDLRWDQARLATATAVGPCTAATVSLAGTRFAHPVVIELETGTLTCDRARFDRGATLRLRYAHVSLDHVTFTGPSSVAGHPRPFRIGADNRVVAAPADHRHTWTTRAAQHRRPAHGQRRAGPVEDWTPAVMSVRGTDLAPLLLADVDLRWCRFAGARHLDALRTDGHSPVHSPPAGWHTGRAWPVLWRWTNRQVIAEEHAWRRQQGAKAAGWQPHPEPDASETVQPQQLAVLYRSLRTAAESTHDHAAARDFSYGEMEARRRCGPRRDRVLLTAYWLLSGYGQHASRTVAALGVLIACLTFLLLGYGLPADCGPRPVTAPRQMITTQGGASTQDNPSPPRVPLPEHHGTTDRPITALRLALGSIVLQDSAQRLTPAGTWTVIAGRVMGPLLLALTALALRARFTR
jgi:hypothetical protein